jgi:hypothetical protein
MRRNAVAARLAAILISAAIVVAIVLPTLRVASFTGA